MGNFLKKLFGSSNDAEIKRLRKNLDKVNALEAEIHALSDEELQAKAPAFQQRLANGETLGALLPGAFAVVRSRHVSSWTRTLALAAASLRDRRRPSRASSAFPCGLASA